MEPMLGEFGAAIDGITVNSPQIPVVSTVGECDDFGSVAYWVRQVREPVRFADAVEKANAVRMVEVGPDGSLTAAYDGIALLHKTEPDAFVRGLAAAWVSGADVNWAAWFARRGARVVDLPTYPFQRERHWPQVTARPGDTAGLGLDAAVHPLLGAAVTLADGSDVLLTGRLSAAAQPWLTDHRIGGAVLVPATAILELVVRAGDEAGTPHVTDLTLLTPLMLPDEGGVRVQVRVAAPGADGTRAVSLHARPDRVLDAPWTLHATGALDAAAEIGDASWGTAWPPAGAAPVSIEDCYERFEGFGYGPAFQGLRGVWRDGAQVYAEVALPAAAGAADPYGLHPALLDAALHALLVIREPGGAQRLPYAWTGVTLHAAGAAALRVRLTDDGADRLRIEAADVAGQPVLTVDALRDRVVTTTAAPTADADGLYRVDWVPVPAAGAAGTVAVLGDGLPGADAIRVPSLTDLAGGGLRPDTVVVEVPGGGTGPADFRARAADLLALAQQWLADERFAASRLVAVTRGAAGPDVTDPSAASAWGLLRVAQSENPGRFGLADVETDADLTVALAALADEPQIVVRGGVPLAGRLARLGTDAGLLPPPGDWRLTATGGGLAGITAEPAPEEPLTGAQVRVRVTAAGLTFHDVLDVLGREPGDSGPLGGEVAGVVVGTGPDATALRPGDRVMGLVTGGLGTVAVAADERLLHPVPAGWPDAEAASMPYAFLAAAHALRDLAGVSGGDRVLIHAGATGLGQAAVQLARHLGADVYATASAGKQHVLRDLGLPADRIGDSRSTAVAEAFRKASGGHGMDVVLGPPAGEVVEAYRRLLAPGGRLLVTGRAVEPLPGAVVVDLDAAGPDRIRALYAEVLPLIAGGVLTLPPVTAFDLRSAPDAFRHVSLARHTGKVVLTVPPVWDRDGTVLITGGTGGLGAVLARRLAEQGQRRVLVVSRRGPSSPGAAELCRVPSIEAVACDVTDPQALRALVAGIDGKLAAVVHAAGVLDDGVLARLTPERLDTVLRPKVDPAWLLHEATLDREPAAFVLYSSVAGLIGGAGQANYAAANTFLDALAAYRAHLGLPATSLAWGPWQESGMAADGAVRGGFASISVERGLAMFDAAVRAAGPLIAPLLIRPADGRGPVPALFRDMAGGARRTAAAATTAPGGAAEKVAALPVHQRLAYLVDLVRAEAAAVLGHASPDGVEPDRDFQALGFDSLTAVELRNSLGAATGLRMPATMVFDYATPQALAEFLLSELDVDAAAADGGSVFAELDRLETTLAAAALDEQTRSGVATRLRRLLDGWRGEEDGAESVAGRLESAGRDEIFDFIDNELGRISGR
ncbi:MAG: SDR family NAD(P)-dependent oxidoreductase [Actinomycetota bacterium]|nr:SDR family NAD(P)-dependent oxidoreductase [Actinomycetota bacterium]